MLEPFAFVANDIQFGIPGAFYGTNASCNIPGADYIASYDKWQDAKVRLGNNVSILKWCKSCGVYISRREFEFVVL